MGEKLNKNEADRILIEKARIEKARIEKALSNLSGKIHKSVSGQQNIWIHKSTNKMTWNDAKLYCENLAPGVKLAYPRNLEEHDLLTQDCVFESCWTGIKRYPNRDYKYVDGSVLSWFKWRAVYDNADNQCIYMMADGWGDFFCSSETRPHAV